MIIVFYSFSWGGINFKGFNDFDGFKSPQNRVIIPKFTSMISPVGNLMGRITSEGILVDSLQ